jgi:cell division protein FtsZ
VKFTVIATGFHGGEAERRTPSPRATQVQVPQQAAVTKALPPPLPAEAKPKPEPVRLTAPATVTARQPVSVRREPPVYKPMDEDQYDIPAFLRRGGTTRE